MEVAYVVAPDRPALGPGGDNQVERSLESWSVAGATEQLRVEIPGIGLLQCELRSAMAMDTLAATQARPVQLHRATSDGFILPA